MKNLLKSISVLSILIGLSFVFLFLYLKMTGNFPYLSFSDAAKNADIARNLYQGKGYGAKFIFFGFSNMNYFKLPLFPAWWVPPTMPYAILLAFRVLGIFDWAVITISGFFYILLVLMTYLLGKKLYSSQVGYLASAAVASNASLLNYAVSGASEVLFTFESLTAAFLLILRKKWATNLSFLFFVLMYFTRPQAFIFILTYILLWLFLNFKKQKVILYFIAIVFLGFVADLVISKYLAGNFFLYGVTGRAAHAVTEVGLGFSSSDVLRGSHPFSLSLVQLFKKVFYNLYNFYRLLPQIMSPYLWALFVIGLFKWGKDKLENSLKIATIFMVVLTFLATALTIPLFRYLHPIVPLVYLFAVATLVWIVRQIFNFKILNSKQFQIFKFKLTKKLFVTLVSVLLVFFFAVGQTLGVIFLDSRYKAKTVNKGKPPVYVQLSYILKENTEQDDVIVTNLDTWGSWYGERRTVWYPLKPEQLNLKEDQNPFDAIFLTNYLMDDENYYMGPEWRLIFENPQDPNKWDRFVAENYEFAGEFRVPPDETYERQEGKAILLVRKTQNPKLKIISNEKIK